MSDKKEKLENVVEIVQNNNSSSIKKPETSDIDTETNSLQVGEEFDEAVIKVELFYHKLFCMSQ